MRPVSRNGYPSLAASRRPTALLPDAAEPSTAIVRGSVRLLREGSPSSTPGAIALSPIVSIIGAVRPPQQGERTFDAASRRLNLVDRLLTVLGPLSITPAI